MRKADDDDGEDDDAKNDGDGDFFEFEFAVATLNGAVDAFGHKGEDGEDDGELRNDNASFDESVDDEPRMAKQSDFCEEDAEDEGGVAAVVHVVVLSEDVTGGAVADDKFEE